MARITKVLVANRGEIASRVIRAARDLDIATVAVFSDPDVDAPYVREADESVPLRGSSPSDTYLDIQKLLNAAKSTGTDAIHPGYGFLSERSEFARACGDEGLIFIGPAPETIELMGSKVTAKELMRDAGVPVLPGATFDGSVDVEAIEVELGAIGYPVLVKAAYGGGGRGMRIVRDPSEIRGAVESAQREAESAFGNGLVFLERFVENPRHIEVQIFGDGDGSITHLFERECSVQRRYQKIIEEAPSPAVSEELRSSLCEAAVLAGRALSYVGAGTVEFVMDKSGSFFFLEVNTRLQVEHPVTEMITGIDLVGLQFAVAEGRPLPPEVMNPHINGHAIEVRLYAEDVLGGFVPTAGELHRFHVPAREGIRVDSGVTDGSIVSIHYDPMLAKVISHAPDRLQACRKLASVLRSSVIEGVTTNRELLVGILRDEGFQAGDFDTGYLDRNLPVDLISTREAARRDTLHPLAAALAAQSERRGSAPVLRTISPGWRNVPSSLQKVVYLSNEDYIEVQYGYRRLDPKSARVLDAVINGRGVPELVVRHISAELVDLEIEGVRRRLDVRRFGGTVFVTSALGASVLQEQPRFPSLGESEVAGSLVSPMPGTVVRIESVVGQMVAPGDPIMVIEAMKMEHVIHSPVHGVLTELRVAPGQTVDLGLVLAVVEVENPE